MNTQKSDTIYIQIPIFCTTDKKLARRLKKLIKDFAEIYRDEVEVATELCRFAENYKHRPVWYTVEMWNAVHPGCKMPVSGTKNEEFAIVPESAVPQQENNTSFVGNYKEPSKTEQKVSKTLRCPWLAEDKQPVFEPEMEKNASVPESAVPHLWDYKPETEEIANVPETDATIVGKSDIRYEPLSVFIEYVTAQEWSFTVDSERLLNEIEYAYMNGKDYWNTFEEFLNLVKGSFD
jgi:hypothetical protein